MDKAKLFFSFSTLLAAVLFIASCTKDVDDTKFYVVNAPMSASQTIPASNATSGGAIDATYDRSTKTLSYKVSWVNLLDTATTLHVHGLADSGAVALSPYPNGIIQTFTRTSTPALSPNKASGSFSSTLYIDGVVLKEEDLLAGKYYIDLHTKAKPAGELRGQIRFQQ